jgi:hypothetical protein
MSAEGRGSAQRTYLHTGRRLSAAKRATRAVLCPFHRNQEPDAGTTSPAAGNKLRTLPRRRGHGPRVAGGEMARACSCVPKNAAATSRCTRRQLNDSPRPRSVEQTDQPTNVVETTTVAADAVDAIRNAFETTGRTDCQRTPARRRCHERRSPRFRNDAATEKTVQVDGPTDGRRGGQTAKRH